MPGKSRTSRPAMNGAARRLLKLRVEEESDAKLLSQAVLDLTVVERGIKVVKAVAESLSERAMEIRQAETMASTAAWRIIAEYTQIIA